MMRHLVASAVALVGLAAPLAPAAAADAYTTRVEPRPFYGATVTVEAGVRVFRPLPPHRHVIINPGDRSSLNFSYVQSEENINRPRAAPFFLEPPLE